MQKMAGRKDLLLVGDSKLISYGNVAAMDAAGVRFVAPLGAARTPDEVFAGLDLAAAAKVDYVAERHKYLPEHRRDTYHLLEGDDAVLTKKGQPDLRCRRVFVYSSANARAQATNRARKLGKAQPELEKLARNAGSRYYPDSDAVAAKLAILADKYRVRAYLRSTITTAPDGKPHLQWSFDQAALDTEAASDGWYALITNIPADQATPAKIFLDYKGQPIAERRYGDLKGPLAVAPLYLQHNRRITALVSVICLALLIFCSSNARPAPTSPPKLKSPASTPTTTAPSSPRHDSSSTPWPTCASSPHNTTSHPKCSPPTTYKPGSSPCSESIRRAHAGRRSETQCARAGLEGRYGVVP